MDFKFEFQKLCRHVLRKNHPMQQQQRIGLKVGLPPSLEAVLGLLEGTRLACHYNRLSGQEVQEIDSYVAFATEYQNAIIWAFDPTTGHDPIVYQGQINDGKIDWYLEPETMESFLISFLYWNAANGGGDFGIIGQIKNSNSKALMGGEVIWRSPDLQVRWDKACFIISGETIYVFGAEKKEILKFVKRFKVEVIEPGNCYT